MKVGDQVTGITPKGEEVSGVVSAIQNNTAVVILPNKERHLIVLDGKAKKEALETKKKETKNNCRPKLAKKETKTEAPKKKTQSAPSVKKPESVDYPKTEKEVMAMKTDLKPLEPNMVHHPPHYQIGGMETIEVLELVLTPEEYLGYLKGNIIKYRERAKFKGNEKEDYEKALWYKKRLEGMK